jgi:hypothetical protein
MTSDDTYTLILLVSLIMGTIQGLVIIKKPFTLTNIILSGFSGCVFGLFTQALLLTMSVEYSFAFISLQALSVIYLLRFL